MCQVSIPPTQVTSTFVSADGMGGGEISNRKTINRVRLASTASKCEVAYWPLADIKSPEGKYQLLVRSGYNYGCTGGQCRLLTVVGFQKHYYLSAAKVPLFDRASRFNHIRVSGFIPSGAPSTFCKYQIIFTALTRLAALTPAARYASNCSSSKRPSDNPWSGPNPQQFPRAGF